MASILTPTQVEAAVIALASQRTNITARRLAREAMVSPATLYSVVDSISHAIDLGQAAVAADAVPRLIAAASLGKVGPLAEWIQSNWGVAGIFFDPSRNGGVPELSERLERDRRGVGALMAFGSFEGSPEFEVALTSIFRDSPTCHVDLLTSPSGVEISADVLIADVWDETRRLIRATTEDRAVRLAAIDLLEAAEPDGWTFRRVAEITQLPLVSVHRAGSRFDQIDRAVQDFGAGLRSVTVTWCTTPAEGIVASFSLLARAPGICQALGEVTTRQLRTGGRALFADDNGRGIEERDADHAAHIYLCMGAVIARNTHETQLSSR